MRSSRQLQESVCCAKQQGLIRCTATAAAAAPVAEFLCMLHYSLRSSHRDFLVKEGLECEVEPPEHFC